MLEYDQYCKVLCASTNEAMVFEWHSTKELNFNHFELA